jgi:hypothetical protein
VPLAAAAAAAGPGGPAERKKQTKMSWPLAIISLSFCCLLLLLFVVSCLLLVAGSGSRVLVLPLCRQYPAGEPRQPGASCTGTGGWGWGALCPSGLRWDVPAAALLLLLLIDPVLLLLIAIVCCAPGAAPRLGRARRVLWLVLLERAPTCYLKLAPVN